MFRDWSYQDVLDGAEALTKLGFDEVYISKGEPPWDIATSCKNGGTHRIGIATSVWFYAEGRDLPCKLRWSFDLEPREANGKETYFIDVDGCRRVLSLLPLAVAADFRGFLVLAAEGVEAQAKELTETATREYGTAALLRSI